MKTPEILAPCGNLKVLKAAVAAGADAVYFGGLAFNARKSADNFSREDLKEAVQICRMRGVKTNFTLNTLIQESEWPSLLSYLEEILPLGFDALIMQDLGVVRAVAAYYEQHPEVKRAAFHASTQMAVEDLSGALYLKSLGFSRVVLARELSLPEIETIVKHSGLEVEVFVHGALCYSDSGRCLLSAFHGGRSGNRGACAQPCRLSYTALCPEEGKGPAEGYFMNLKDRETLEHLPQLVRMGVKSLKIEGRLKGDAYTAGVTRFYRNLIDRIAQGENPRPTKQQQEEVLQLFNRGGFTEGYFTSKNHMVEPASPKNQGLLVGKVTQVGKHQVTVQSNYDLHPGDELEIALMDGRLSLRVAASMLQGPTKRSLRFKTEAVVRVNDPVYRVVDPVLSEKIRQSVEVLPSVPVSMQITIRQEEPVTLIARSGKIFAKVIGDLPLPAQNKALQEEDVLKQLKKTGGSDFALEEWKIDLDEGLFLPLSSLNQLRRDALELLKEKIGTSQAKGPKTFEILHPAPLNDLDMTTLHGKKEKVLCHPEDIHKITEDPSSLILIPAMEWFPKEKISEFMEEVFSRFGATTWVVPRLPRAGRLIREEQICQEMDLWIQKGAKGFEASRLGQIQMIHEKKALVFAGPDFGVMNQEACRFFEEQRIPYVFSREVPEEEFELLKGHPGFITTSSPVPYMISEQCIYKEAFGCHKRPEGHRTIVTDRKGEEMILISHCPYCYTELFSEKPYVLKGSYENFLTREEYPV